MTDELPEPWGTALSEKGVHSYGDLASRIGGSKSKAHRLVNGDGVSFETIQAAADAFFDGDTDRVQKMRGSRLKVYGPWKPPDAAHLLNPEQRKALAAFITAMVPEERPVTALDDRRRKMQQIQPRAAYGEDQSDPSDGSDDDN